MGSLRPRVVQEVKQMKRLQFYKDYLEDMAAELKTLRIADMMQTAQEQKLAVLVDRLLRLQASAASPRQRESLIMRTMSEINDMRRTVPHISPKNQFSPSTYVEELSQSQGFSMAAAMTAVLSGSFGAGINISMGPLAGCCTVSEAVTAPIQQYVDTQQQCLADVATSVDQAQGDSESSAGRHATRIMTQVIALSMCTMHARKRRLTWFQHLNLQTLRAGKLDLPRWLRIAAIDALKLNMEMYLDTYAHMLRVWTMVCLTPFQMGIICAKAVPLSGQFTQDCPGLYLLEALAVEAGQPTTRELLSSVGNAPVLQAFAPHAYQAADSWQSMKHAAAIDTRMN
ncbi:hypothetical protein WJX84_000429 [Apatococcus fuscideae]|uniref:Uncharacterized protein n=1 Tax=Apatococcus fuscideae TaxID=2026836 RepID=A0AAW1SQZ8_9CHLO